MTTAIAYSIAKAVEATGLSKSHLTDAIHTGQLRAKRSNRDTAGEPIGKYVILAADLDRYLDSLPEA